MSEEKKHFWVQKEKVADALAAMTGDIQPDSQTPQELAGFTIGKDDSVAAPPPDPSVLARPKRSKPRSDPGVETRRILIPILLTLGLLLPIVASLKWVLGDESPFAAWPTGLVVTLFILSPCLLIGAVLNMRHVKRTLQTQSRARHAV